MLVKIGLDFVNFSVYLYMIMYTLNIAKAIKKISVSDIKDFIFESYYNQIEISNDSSCYSIKRLKRKCLLLLTIKLIQKVPDPRNAKEYFE